MMSLQELETAVRNDIDLLVLVLNDDTLGAEYHALDRIGEDPTVTRVQAPDIANVAETLGANGYTVRTFDELHEIADELGRKPDGQLVVDCKINYRVTH